MKKYNQLAISKGNTISLIGVSKWKFVFVAAAGRIQINMCVSTPAQKRVASIALNNWASLCLRRRECVCVCVDDGKRRIIYCWTKCWTFVIHSCNNYIIIIPAYSFILSALNNASNGRDGEAFICINKNRTYAFASITEFSWEVYAGYCVNIYVCVLCVCETCVCVCWCSFLSLHWEKTKVLRATEWSLLNKIIDEKRLCSWLIKSLASCRWNRSHALHSTYTATLPPSNL